jgi:hypothetical protein
MHPDVEKGACLLPGPIPSGDAVTGVEEAGHHALAHVTEADEPNLHEILPAIDRPTGRRV